MSAFQVGDDVVHTSGIRGRVLAINPHHSPLTIRIWNDKLKREESWHPNATRLVKRAPPSLWENIAQWEKQRVERERVEAEREQADTAAERADAQKPQ